MSLRVFLPRRPSPETVQDACSHVTSIRRRERSPYITEQTDKGGKDEDRPSTESCLDGDPSTRQPHVTIENLEDAPEEITETKNENANAGEFDHGRQIGVERLHQLRKHRRERQWSQTLAERHCRGHADGAHLPEPVPILRTSAFILQIHAAGAIYQRIMRALGGLWHQHSVGGFDKVDGAHVSHDLRSGIDLGIELLLDLMDRL